MLLKRFRVIVLLFFGTFYISYAQQSQGISLEKLQEIAIVDQKVMMPMRDGIRLATDIYRPKGDKPVPVIFSRTPYNFNGWGDGEPRGNYQAAYDAVSRGYAYVVQNERGRFFSEGEWDILGTPLTDGWDAFDWFVKQPWCNGSIGLIGCSSTAEWQMAVAAMGHPALKAIVPQAYGAGVGRIGKYYEQGNWYRGGATQMLFIAWLYGTQNDAIRPQFPKNATQEQLIRASRQFDLAPERERVDWAKGLAHLPVKDILRNVNGPEGIYNDMVARKPNDPAWYKGGLYHDNMHFHVPAFWMVSWYDVASSPNLAMVNHIKEKAAANKTVADNQYLIIAPTLHCSFTRATENTIVGERSVGDARLNYNEQIFKWWDKWLKGNSNSDFAAKTPKVQYYTMGLNKWQTAETWPPAGVQMQTMYLSSNGRANSLHGDGKLSSVVPAKNAPADGFTYDPMNPVPSYGGNVCCTGNAVQGGAFDQRRMETRNDILVYTSEPLTEDTEVSGFIESTIYVGSDAKDTDFTIKLIDVHPDGSAYNLDETIQRARWRDGYEKEVWMEKGKVYKIDMTPMSTSNLFKKGHRIRVEISSSNFPRFDRNLNTGGNNYDEKDGVVANNLIFHNAQYPSQVRLPVLKK
jgi:putative CocE/NonD family hydrolase